MRPYRPDLSRRSATPRALETLMSLHKYEYQSEFARKWFALGFVLGFQEGREAGRQEGREAGRREAEAAMRAVLLRQLSQRFGDLPSAIRDRVSQAQLEALEQWIERVIPAASLADIFDDA